MGTLIRVVFREGTPKRKLRVGLSRRTPLSRERGLTLWREREDLVIAAAYRVAPPGEAAPSMPDNPPLKFAPLA